MENLRMKNRMFKAHRRGFTLAELLMVIAILIILIGLGVTGFLALRQKIQIAKYDDLAREIYVAVQNQLTRLEANGMDASAVDVLKQNGGIATKPEDYEDGDWTAEQPNYRHANEHAQVMELLLPLGAVADDVRSNSFFCVEYNVKANMVYGVFYSEKQFAYDEVSTMTGFRLSRNTRKGPMVGYYGGSAVRRDEQIHCPAPELEIINNNELRLNILNVPADGTTVKVLVFDGEKTADASSLVTLDVTKRTVLLDGMGSGEHFHERFPDLTPGRDLTITVVYEKPGAISSSASVSANSLFATREPGEREPEGGVSFENPGDTVTIAWARHLQNLESSVSQLNYEKEDIRLARQTEHIQWEEKFGQFVSIRNESADTKLQRYEGSNLEIRDLSGVNGLFAETGEKVTLSGIRLVDPKIEAPAGATQSVGALVGKATGSSIFSCGVYYHTIDETDHTVDYDAYRSAGLINRSNTVTGGLIGTASKTEVQKSFAALPSIQAEKGASLIGNATDCKISESYANCDDLPEEQFRYFIGGSGNTVEHCYAVGNVEKEEKGTFADEHNTVTDSYYAVSHRQFAADPKDNKDLTATEFCYIKTQAEGWKQTNQEGMTAKPMGDTWSSGMPAALSHPYREYLDGRAYPYPAIGELEHYGSWPDSDGTVDLKITMRLLNNEEAGYAIFAGRVVVTMEKDGKTVTLFDSVDHKDEDGNFDGEDTVKVAPGTAVTITVKSAEGYEYINTVIGGTNTTKPALIHTVTKDTEVVVNFQQRAFRLNGIRPERMNAQGDISTIDKGSYNIDLESPQKTLVVNSVKVTESVETGSTVTVRTQPPQGYSASVVWYTPEGKNGEADRVYLTGEGDRTYSFEMPPHHTDIHVMYTAKEAHFQISYEMMDPSGKYKPQSSSTYSCGVGSQINRSMINAMAESSGLPLVIEGERVRYLAEAVVTRHDGTEVFRIQLDENGRVVGSTDPYITQLDESTKEQPYQVKISIARKLYHVTLTAEDHIRGVRFGTEGAFEKTVSGDFYYGATVTASADVVPGYGFSYWDPQDSRFLMSAEPQYAFQVPYFDLNLRATATLNKRLVTINLLENGESWLYGDESRQADPITLTLVSTVDGSEYPMNVLTEETISYAMQAAVPAIPKYEHGYEVRVDYASGKQSWIYASGGETDEKNTKLLLIVRDEAVERDADFYSITYFPNKQHTLGSVPKGGTYPKYHHITVEGNSGYLRNVTDNEKIFCGWKDEYAEGTGSGNEYYGGESLMLTRRVDMFAQWVASRRVVYDGNGAEGGTLPVDPNEYVDNGPVTVKFGSLTRRGYVFLGWSENKDAEEPTYVQGKTETIEHLEKQVTTLYAIWKLEEYTLRFYDPNGVLLTGGDYEISEKHYGDPVTAPDLEVELSNGTREKIIGWSLTPGGPILCRPGETITVTGNMELYARLADESVTVTFMPQDGKGQPYDTQTFGKGVPGYLNCVPPSGPVTAWSTQPDGKGDLYFCQDDGRSEKAYAFTEDTKLYAVTGKVYNYNKQLWFDTLFDAAKDDRTASGDTLIVYRDTQEPHSIWFNKSLYVIASGNRTVAWKDGATTYDYRTGASGGKLTEEKPISDTDASKEFVGCMNVSNNGGAVKLTFGRSDISNLTMDGGTLTFDANEQSRVISLETKAEFHMYDGVTLTNGWRPTMLTEGNGKNNPGKRSVYGGGVYAGAGSVFYMHGGTISYCTAVSGGGVYLLTGSRMYMGDMVRPTVYSSTAIYYDQADTTLNETIYVNVDGVTAENYKQYWVTAGNPQICYNTSTQSAGSDGGGGLLMLDLNNGELTLYRGSITNNKTSGNGGGVMTDSAANNCFLRIYEVDISHNEAAGNGGGIFQWQGTVYVYNSTIRQNKAAKGGGIHLNQTGKETCNIEFYFGDISDNDATNGGGVYGQGKAVFYLRGGNLCRNKAVNGGGAYLEGSDTKLSFEAGTLSDNTATGIGGGVYSLGSVDMSGGMLSRNVAKKDGGGIWTNGVITMRGGTVSDNSTDAWGGGIYLENASSMTMTGGTICNNNSELLGGGIMVKSSFALSRGSLYGNMDKADPAGWRGGAKPDEVYDTPSPNDIYLFGDNVITIPNGGIQLSGEERVAVDFERDESLRFPNKTLPYRFAEYERPGDYKQQDALYFTYHGTRSTEYSMNNLGKKNLKVVTHDDLKLTGNQDVGLYFAEKDEGDGISSFVILDLNFPDCPGPIQATQPVNQTLNLDTMLTDVEKPIRPGYYLAGWARTPDALEEQYELFFDVTRGDRGQWGSLYQSETGWTSWSDTPGYTVKDYFSQTLYAMWRPYTAAYNLGTDAAANGVTIQPTSVGPHVTLLNPEPVSYTKDGKDYLFDHWVNRADPEKTYLPTQQLDLEDNLYLDAVWVERKAGAVVLTFYYNGGASGTDGELCRKMEVEKGKSGQVPVDVQNITQAGKVLMGWATTPDADKPTYPKNHIFNNLEADMTLYAVWADAVTITYDGNGGEEGSLSDVTNAGGNATIIRTVPKRTGYDFLGWAETPDAAEARYHAGDLFGPVKEDITLYAVWRAKVLVTLMLNDGTGDVFQDTLESVGSAYALTTPAERPGYAFQGWSRTADAAAPDYRAGAEIVVPEDGITLYALWSKDPKYKVTFYGNGGSWGDQTALLVEENDQGILTIPEAPVRSGYLFQGWAASAGAEDIQYPADAGTITGLTEDRSLYAVWKEQAPPPTEPPTQEDPAPTEAADQPETEPPAEEAEAADQTGSQAASSPGEAVWTVSFYLDGVDFLEHPRLSGEELDDCQWDEEEQWLTYTLPAEGNGKLLPPEIKRNGWILEGWQLLDEEDERIVYPAGEEIPVTGSMALIPVWKKERPAPPPAETAAPTEPPTAETTAPPPAEETAPPAAEEAAPPITEAAFQETAQLPAGPVPETHPE